MEGNPVAVACADVITFLRREGIYEHEAAHMRDLNNHGEVNLAALPLQLYLSHFIMLSALLVRGIVNSIERCLSSLSDTATAWRSSITWR